MREQIVATAIGHGYWSVWMTIFHDDIDMVHRLINAFPAEPQQIVSMPKTLTRQFIARKGKFD
jgi:hypothetical protein